MLPITPHDFPFSDDVLYKNDCGLLHMINLNLNVNSGKFTNIWA